MIVPVILAGGVGTRLWPLSRSHYPKQFLPLVSQHSLLQETLLRIQNIQKLSPPIIICHHDHRFIVAEQLQQIDIHHATIILEPVSRNTAPAVAIAALMQLNMNSPLLVLPTDHVVKDTTQFVNSIDHAMHYIDEGKLITFGIKPTSPETAYGYINADQAYQDHGAYQINEFIEKPDAVTAYHYYISGLYYWNSGMFMFRSRDYLKELRQFAPDMLKACQKAYKNRYQDMNFIRLDHMHFENAPTHSIDCAVMEKTQHGLLLPLEADWFDIGSWTMLHQVSEQNAEGNVLQGDVMVEAVKNSYLHANHRLLTVVGVEDHIIVETKDAVLVAHKKESQKIKTIVSRLKSLQRTEIDLHQLVYRPWGHYEILSQGPCYQVKRITIKPGASISLQEHHHRSEHWVVVSGTAEVTRGDEVFYVSPNESTFIPKMMKHRLVNPMEYNLEIIEIQLGEQISEEDIIRFQDEYGRSH